MSNHDFNGELQEILTKAAVDPVFREGLLREPRATLEKTFGRSLPPNLKIKFVTRDPDCDAMFVLPDPVTENDELSQDDLDTVAGGQSKTPESPSDISGGTGGAHDLWTWGDTPPPKGPGY